MVHMRWKFSLSSISVIHQSVLFTDLWLKVRQVSGGKHGAHPVEELRLQRLQHCLSPDDIAECTCTYTTGTLHAADGI